jgi:hypothetical protein
MMFGSQDYSFHTGIDKCLHPLLAVQTSRIERFRIRVAITPFTVIEGMDELLRELRYQGNNLNQLTVMARQGRITQVNYEPFTEVYRNAWQTLNSLLSHAV